MKKSKTLLLIAFGVLASVAGLTLFGGNFVSATEAEISEIVANPAAYDSQSISIEGIVVEWEVKEYSISITGEDYSATHVVERYYLIVQDIETEDLLKIRLNYRKESLEFSEDTFTVGETLTIEGIVKEFQFEALSEDIDIDLVVIAKSIIFADGTQLEILTDADIENFQANRMEKRERRETLRNKVKSGEIQDQIEEIQCEVINWEIREFNLTIEGEDLYHTRIIERNFLVVKNLDNDSIILVKVHFPRLNSSLSEDFIAVGDHITIKGILRDGAFDPEEIEAEIDQVMLGISITNADGDETVLISKEIFVNARESGHFKTWRSQRATRLRKARTE